MTEQDCVLAIDLGTSGPKVALVTMQGDVLGHEIETTPLHLLDGGGAEQDPEDWWTAITTAVARLHARQLASRDRIVALCCTTQWSGTVPVDRDNRPLCRAIIWMDSRGSRYMKRLTGGLVAIDGYSLRKLPAYLRLTGGAPGHSGKDSIAHMLWLKDQRPDIYRAAHKLLEPMDWLNARLTGRMAASFATITLTWVTDNRDIRNVHYSDLLIRRSGIDRAKLPELLPVDAVLGTLTAASADALGLNPSVQVVMGTPDLHSAAVGSGAVRDYESHFYVGTSSWLTCHVPFKKTDLLHNMASLPSGLPGRYFIADEQETSGACLTFLRDNIVYHKDALLQETHQPDVYKVFDQIVASVPAGSHRLLFTPWLYGERTPVEDHSVRGSFFNISLQTTREHMLRAVYEGVAFNARWLLHHVERFAGRRLDPIRIIGGGATSDVWCQIFADVWNHDVQQVKDPIQANARGAGLLAAMALGRLRLEDIPERVPIARTFTPTSTNRAVYDEMFEVFLQLYKRNKGLHARLNRH
ncbi:MAG: FGGY-family carbohydrate kinase [Pseudomonadota bacterium]